MISKIEQLIRDSYGEAVRIEKLGSLCKVFSGAPFKSEYFNSNGDGIPLVRIRDVNTAFSGTYYSGNFEPEYVVNKGDILISMDGLFSITKWRWGLAVLNQRVVRLQDFRSDVFSGFIFYFLKKEIESMNFGRQQSTVAHLSIGEIREISIPVPSLEIQKEIANVLDQFTELEAELEAELEVRTIQYEELRARVMDFSNGVREHPLKKIIKRSSSSGVPQVSLDSLCSIQIGEFVKKTFQNDEYQYPVFNGGTTATGYYSEFNSPERSVVVSARGSIGFVNFLETKFWAGNSCYVLRPLSNNLHPKFLYYSLKTRERGLFELRSVGSIPALNLAPVKTLQIPLPSIETQERIVEVLDKFDALVNDIKFGLPAELNARRKQYEYYRNKLLTFKEIDAA